ncbi:hypothetical protein [Achromobacter insuavis]|uniref:hypothetical protein n=1 Tax=Achromobacter insuavis TaxID=1287735 RepID=UPI000A2F1981|nr:hypothetical protein [Achromobacter insuavis]
MHYVVYIDEFGHVGPFLSRDHAQYKTSPVFGFGGFLIPVDAARLRLEPARRDDMTRLIRSHRTNPAFRFPKPGL